MIALNKNKFTIQPLFKKPVFLNTAFLPTFKYKITQEEYGIIRLDPFVMLGRVDQGQPAEEIEAPVQGKAHGRAPSEVEQVDGQVDGGKPVLRGGSERHALAQGRQVGTAGGIEDSHDPVEHHRAPSQVRGGDDLRVPGADVGERLALKPDTGRRGEEEGPRPVPLDGEEEVRVVEWPDAGDRELREHPSGSAGGIGNLSGSAWSSDCGWGPRAGGGSHRLRRPGGDGPRSRPAAPNPPRPGPPGGGGTPRYLLPGAGHMLTMERPDEVRDAIKAALFGEFTNR